MADRCLKSVVGVTPEGKDLVGEIVVAAPWVAFYCAKCGNPLGVALPPEVKLIRWVVKNTSFEQKVERIYPRYGFCGKCINPVLIDWRECPEIAEIAK